MAGKYQTESKKRSRKPWLILLLLSLILVLGAAIWYVVSHGVLTPPLDPSQYRDPAATGTPTLPAQSETAPASSLPAPDTEPAATTTEAPLVDNPVDFDALKERNEDVYAWIYIPMQPEKPDIDLPVLQSRQEDDDNYYLHRDIDRLPRYAGCIYTQKANAKDFSDRVTVVYGHNMLDGTMFSNLVCFQDTTFFDEHEYFYIYIPGHILTYRIAAAIKFDTRHLLNCFDFSDDRVYESWIRNYILEPKTMIRNVRKDIEVTVEDKLVVLSTCIERSASRYLIQGVLIRDERTN